MIHFGKISIGAQSDPVPGTAIGQIDCFDARLEPEQRQSCLHRIGIGGILKGAGLQDEMFNRCHCLGRARAARARRTDRTRRGSILFARQDLVKVKARFVAFSSRSGSSLASRGFVDRSLGLLPSRARSRRVGRRCRAAPFGARLAQALIGPLGL